LDRLDEAIADYDAALNLDPRMAVSLYGRDLAKQKKGDQAAADADIAAAKAIMATFADEFAKYGVNRAAAAALPVPPRRKRYLLRPIAYHRHYGRAVWIDPVVLRAVTISWNNIRIPVRSWPYHGHIKPRPWLTNDVGVPRMGWGTKCPQVTQHQGRSESERYGHHPHASTSLPQRQGSSAAVHCTSA
jgi:hypothetical protein